MEKYFEWILILLTAILVEYVGEKIFRKKSFSRKSKIFIALIIAVIVGILIPYLFTGITFILFLESLVVILLITSVHKITIN